MTIEELNERISQLTALLISAEGTIKNTNEMIRLAEQERDRLADERKKTEPNFKRVEQHKNYYSITIDERINCSVYREEYWGVDDNHFDNNNYFYTRERAQEVANKIKFLLKLERLHDIYCPDYKPSWNSFPERKYFVLFGYETKKWEVNWYQSFSPSGIVYFPTEEIAQKVCDILNKECEENDNS